VETTPRWYFFYEKGEKRCVKGEERKRERKRNRRKRKRPKDGY
jgi:hypothetical protein